MGFVQKRETLKKVERFIISHNLVDHDHHVLIGVSGGVDSVVLMHMLLALDYNCIVAHMNFKLRGAESEEDARFVKSLCLKYGCAFRYKEVDTSGYASKRGISIEMAARELRYSWFDQILKDDNAQVLVVGHHLNDSIETVFLNMVRTTGIRGVSGIDPKNGNVVRPLLCLTRQEVLDYAEANRLSYRNDASNDDVIYKRNLVRHKIIPKFIELEPAFVSNMDKTLSYLKQTKDLLDDVVLQWKAENFHKKGDVWCISYKMVYEKSYGKLLLYEVLKDFGFRNDQVALIYEAGNNEPGRKFYSNSHIVYSDRDEWMVVDKDLKEDDPIHYIDDVPCSYTINGRELRLKHHIIDRNYNVPRDSDSAAFDYSKLAFPLVLRKWKQGDWFIPLGMKGRKKISDFLIDNKVSLLDKSSVYVLESAGRIVWVVGLRLDNRFKIENNTKEILTANFM